ncbi:hypothetical protein D6D06_01366 [Aureobasidium pullulans]|nr:hypothetical protein D6D06_01366 [Aureobasidium pullulans]
MSRSPADLLEISYTRATSASQNYTTEWPSAHPITAIPGTILRAYNSTTLPHDLGDASSFTPCRCETGILNRLYSRSCAKVVVGWWNPSRAYDVASTKVYAHC